MVAAILSWQLLVLVRPRGDDTHIECRVVNWELHEGSRAGKSAFTFFSSEMSSDSSDKISW